MTEYSLAVVGGWLGKVLPWKDEALDMNMLFYFFKILTYYSRNLGREQSL